MRIRDLLEPVRTIGTDEARAYMQEHKEGTYLLPDMTPEALEGGYNLRRFLEEVKPRIETVPDALGIVIMLEAQAMDLYMRFAYQSEKDVSRKLLYSIAEEEKSHLKSLGRLMDKKVRA